MDQTDSMTYTILIADDDTGLLKMLQTFFELKKYTVLTARDGAEALKMAEKDPDIILLDINMPRTDGLEVCRQIRDRVRFCFSQRGWRRKTG